MAQRFEDQFKRFEARTKSVGDAFSYLTSFYCKFGILAGRTYLCSETAIQEPTDGAYHIRIGLIPWPYEVRSDQKADFEKLISDLGATEIAN